MIAGDAFLLHQALGNLIDNSIDFSPASSTIKVFAEVQEEQARIMIEDQGPGIPDYAMDKIFTKFFSLKRPDSGRKSTGLGLNFVMEVAALHNGTITLENLGSSGTRATLTLPV
jgi:two-component system sensor histidine kinase CreC